MKTIRIAACILLLLSVFADSFNGFFKGIPISIAFKAVVIGMALATLNATHMKIVGAVIGYYIFSVLYTALFHDLIMPDVLWALRNIMLLVATLFFIELLSGEQRKQWAKTVFNLCVIALSIFAFNIALGLMGIGNYQYDYGPDAYGAGGKGFITAGNELIAAVLAICGVLILRIGNMPVARRLAMYAGMATLLVLTSTKSGMLGLLLLIGLREGASADVSNKRKVVMLLILLIVVWIGFDYVLHSFAGRRFLYFLETDGIARAVFSQRNYWAGNALYSFFSHANIFDFLFGIGADETARANQGKHMVEMDIVDFFVTYGLIGVFVSHLPFLYVLYIIRVYSASALAPTGGVILFMCLATFTGHVLNGGTSASYLAVFLAMTAFATETRYRIPRTRQSRTRSEKLRKNKPRHSQKISHT